MLLFLSNNSFAFYVIIQEYKALTYKISKEFFSNTGRSTSVINAA